MRSLLAILIFFALAEPAAACRRFSIWRYNFPQPPCPIASPEPQAACGGRAGYSLARLDRNHLGRNRRRKARCDRQAAGFEAVGAKDPFVGGFFTVSGPPRPRRDNRAADATNKMSLTRAGFSSSPSLGVALTVGSSARGKPMRENRERITRVSSDEARRLKGETDYARLEAILPPTTTISPKPWPTTQTPRFSTSTGIRPTSSFRLARTSSSADR